MPIDKIGRVGYNTGKLNIKAYYLYQYYLPLKILYDSYSSMSYDGSLGSQ